MATKSVAKKKPGRPRLRIDADQVRKLAELGCNDTEIGGFFSCDPQTISRRFSGELAKGRAELKIALRRKQVELAMNGDRTLLIWLGKQVLGQGEPGAHVAIQNNLISSEKAGESSQEQVSKLVREWKEQTRQRLGLPSGDQ